MESEKDELIKNREWNVDYQGMRGGGSGEILIKGHTLPVIRGINSRELMCSLVTIVNVLHNWKLLRE